MNVDLNFDKSTLAKRGFFGGGGAVLLAAARFGALPALALAAATAASAAGVGVGWLPGGGKLVDDDDDGGGGGCPVGVGNALDVLVGGGGRAPGLGRPPGAVDAAPGGGGGWPARCVSVDSGRGRCMTAPAMLARA